MTDALPPTSPRAGSSRRSQRRSLRVLIRLVLACASLVAAELVFRTLADRLGFDEPSRIHARDYVCRGWAAGYAAHPHTVYRHPPELPEVNSNGFIDREWKLERTPGVPRILCLGGSTTEGGNALSLQGSYPFLLEQVLRERLGREVEVLNAGMSGWNSAEMVAAWFLDLVDYQPDLVVVHEAVNDVDARDHEGFRRDYSHFRHTFVPRHYGAFTRWLARRSDLWLWLVCGARVPTIVEMTVVPSSGSHDFDGQRFSPATNAPYRRNLLSIGRSVEDHGGTLAFLTMICDPDETQDLPIFARYRAGVLDNNQVMRELAAEQGWILCDLARLESARMAEWQPWFLDLVHVSPEGNRRKAERLAEALIGQGFFERFPLKKGMAGSPTGGD